MTTKKRDRKLSPANLEIMKVVWEKGEVTINDVVEAKRQEKKKHPEDHRPGPDEPSGRLRLVETFGTGKNICLYRCGGEAENPKGDPRGHQK